MSGQSIALISELHEGKTLLRNGGTKLNTVCYLVLVPKVQDLHLALKFAPERKNLNFLDL